MKSIIEKRTITYYPITIGRTFGAAVNPQFDLDIKIYAEQHNIISELASKSDCLIIGRCSDYILRKYSPFNIFVYANIDSRLLRCRQRAPNGEHLSDFEMKKRFWI